MMSIFGRLLLETFFTNVAFELLLRVLRSDFEIFAFGFDVLYVVVATGCRMDVIIGVGAVGVVNYKFRFNFNGREVIVYLERRTCFSVCSLFFR